MNIGKLFFTIHINFPIFIIIFLEISLIHLSMFAIHSSIFIIVFFTIH